MFSRPAVAGLARPREHAQATPLVAVVLLAAALLAIPVAHLGRGVIDRATAQTAADAAALAGALHGAGEARAIAVANGGTVVRYLEQGRHVEVDVRVGSFEATARVERTITGGGSARVGLDPRMLVALARADARLGTPVPVVSGLRSRADQERLWQHRHRNPYPVARPGTSRHERGTAIDVPASFVDRLVSVAGAVGLCRPLPRTDPIHFEVC